MSHADKELQALGAFLLAMHDQGLDGAKMRAAMLQTLGVQPEQPDCRTCTQHVVSCWSNIKCVNGDQHIEAPKVVLWRTE